MNPQQGTPPNPLSHPLLGSIVSGAVTAVVVTVIAENDIEALLLLIAIAAGAASGILTWFLLQWPSRWLEKWDYESQQRRKHGEKLKRLQGDIWFASQRLTQTLHFEGDVIEALKQTADLDSELLELSITLPEFPPDYDAASTAEGWDSFLCALYPYARDGDIARARRLGRRTRWRRLWFWCRERWWTLQDRSVVRWLRTFRRRSSRRDRRRRGRSR